MLLLLLLVLVLLDPEFASEAPRLIPSTPLTVSIDLLSANVGAIIEAIILLSSLDKAFPFLSLSALAQKSFQLSFSGSNDPRSDINDDMSVDFS